MTYGKLWPAHPQPLPDELLSSWIVRVAAANGIKLQTLSWMLFGNAQSPWNRDIDRAAPPWLIKTLSHHTGTNYWKAFHTTLVTYRMRLYPYRQAVGQLRWVLPVHHHGMRYRGFGQQFCPVCLATDQVAYFRKQWRIALFTYCPIHQVELHDACPSCGAPVVHYRGDFGKELKDALPMYICHACGADLREAEGKPAHFSSDELHQMFDTMLWSLCGSTTDAGRFDLGFFAVLHQLCRVMGMRQNQGKLLCHLLEQIRGAPAMTGQATGRTTIEERRRDERHVWLLCGLWLMADLKSRLGNAWRTKAIRYNLLLKDFERPPKWFVQVAEEFSNWRMGSNH